MRSTGWKTTCPEWTPPVKGHKQLTKSIEQVRTNMKANGYELVALLEATMTLACCWKQTLSRMSPWHKEDLIARVNPMEIRYNGKMIRVRKSKFHKAFENHEQE